MRRTRILLAEDHTMVAEAFQRLLEPQYEVIGIVADGQSLLKVAQQLKQGRHGALEPRDIS